MKRIYILFWFVIICLSTVGCARKTDLEEPVTEIAAAKEPDNPIDTWYLEMKRQNLGTPDEGIINYLYRSAWQTELQHMTEMISTPEALAYYDAIRQEAEALEELLEQQEEFPGTGSESWITYESAKVYKKAVDTLRMDISGDWQFVFDPEQATEEFRKAE